MADSLSEREVASLQVVGSPASKDQQPESGLDALINETIQRAKDIGYSLQALRNRVRERLLEEPADHLLVVEEEAALRAILQREIQQGLNWRVECCSHADLVREPGRVIGAQVLAPCHLAADLGNLVPSDRPCFSIEYSSAADQLALIRGLNSPSNIAVVSVSQSLLRTARSLLAPSIEREHTYQELLLSSGHQVDMGGADLVFCDSIALSRLSGHRKVPYRLVSTECLQSLSELLSPARLRDGG